MLVEPQEPGSWHKKVLFHLIRNTRSENETSTSGPIQRVSGYKAASRIIFDLIDSALPKRQTSLSFGVIVNFDGMQHTGNESGHGDFCLVGELYGERDDLLNDSSIIYRRSSV